VCSEIPYVHTKPIFDVYAAPGLVLDVRGEIVRVEGIFCNKDIDKGTEIPGTGFTGWAVSSDQKGFHMRSLMHPVSLLKVTVDGSGGIRHMLQHRAGELGAYINSPSGSGFEPNVKAPSVAGNRHVAVRAIHAGEQLFVGYGAQTKSIFGGAVVKTFICQRAKYSNKK
jgi:hypothetical protein